MDILGLIKSKKAVVGVIGLGYVGLPLAKTFAKKGFKVIGFDSDRAKIEALLQGKSYIKHIPSTTIKDMLSIGFEPTNNFARLSECDCVLICVPTPLTGHREPDMTYVENSCKVISQNLRKGQLIVLESTTYPGTTEEVVRPTLESSGLQAGKDFFVGYSPEREDPGNERYETSTIPKVVGADDPYTLELLIALYGQVVVKVVPVSSSKVAEATKILENTFRAINIALVNELKMVFTEMGIDVWEVIDAASTKPFGFMRFNPGPGLGGHCIPIDPFYLSWKAKEFDMPCRFIEMAGEINTFMPHYVVSRTMEAFSVRGMGLKDAKILLIGLAYKKNVDDCRESPSFKLIELFERFGSKVMFHDPYVLKIPVTREYPHLAGRESVALEFARDADAVVIATDHDCIDYDALLKDARLIVDTRGVYKGAIEKVIKA